ncbi:MAG: hypothetical protein KGQ66_21615 [Acidobacteriota bacterium]|nr:hypothetical protein [Acidobacteriota bacterium]
MQLTMPPSELIEPLVESAGFTFVEEDDVAFSLGLCREVNRIYGDYQDGRLPSDDSVLAGLSVTVEMLAVLSQSVRDGMPAMRITVAAAQTREMLVVVFGHDPMHKGLDDSRRDRWRDLIATAALQSPVPAALPAPSADQSGRSLLGRWFSRRRR